MEEEGNSNYNQKNSNYYKTPTGILIPKKNCKENKSKLKNLSRSVKKGQISKRGKLDTTAMNSWEEAFTNAAAWQYKHQIAYWKAKAKALQYENRVLHDIIRKNNGDASTSQVSQSASNSDLDSEVDDMEFDDTNPSSQKNRGDCDLEVSEAFIEFLSANAKFKEDARLERERLNAQYCSENEDEAVKRMEAPPERSPEQHTDDLKNLYGNKWREISAMEIAMKTKFISECDRYKPIYWPNIPFNFNYN